MVVVVKLFSESDSSFGCRVNRVGSNPGHDTFKGDCFSPPRGDWVPVRAEMVLVIDLA